MTSPTIPPDDHQRFSALVAAYSLGALEVDEREPFEVHLSGCDECRRELASLAPIPGLLARVDRAELESRPDAARAERIELAARAELAANRRSAARWRAATAALAAAALVLGGLLAISGLDDPPPSRDLADVISSTATTTAVSTIPKGWGTEIHLDLAGLPHRSEYRLWVIDASGDWFTAATWGPTPTGRALLTGATSVSAGEVTRIVVTSSDRGDVLVDTRAT